MSAGSVMESGRINMISSRAKELNMTCEEYIMSDYLKEVENQYGTRIVRSIYSTKYKEYL